MTLRLKLDAMRSATTTSARTRSAVSVWARNTIGRAMPQMHSDIWQSLTRSRRLIPGGLGDRHPHASALTGLTELSFETRHFTFCNPLAAYPENLSKPGSEKPAEINAAHIPFFPIQ